MTDSSILLSALGGESVEDMEGLRQAIEALPADAWQLWYTEKGGMTREWADVPFTPVFQDNHRPEDYLGMR